MKKLLLSITAVLALGLGANSFAQSSLVTANNDTVTVLENDSIKIAVLANDEDQSGSATLAIADSALNGIVRIEDDSIVYIPSSGFSGIDSFVYTLRAIPGPLPLPGTTDNATVYVTVTSTAGITRIALTQSKVTPNPVIDAALITFENTGIATVRIYDITGKAVINTTTAGNNFVFEKGNLAAGTYFYNVSNTKVVIAAGKIAIQ